MTPYPRKEHYTAEDLVEIIRILRDPDTGCPWDKVQTHASIRMNFLEVKSGHPRFARISVFYIL